ncbi:glycosyltransferase family 4 protein [uncultured Microbulbifer sp.]|uniref:glycosyltransferase family 4 protein n=1 Tax=uncultured Microbulbifer sp. TaxID=348147 RepID=UPI0026122398|nr:glycosyltransferase family 4 protein [uncultured Microbulbifer sp.]
MNKLLILSVDYFPKIGGISLMTHHLANGFCQIGWDVTVVAPRDALVPADYKASYSLAVDFESKPNCRANFSGLKERKRIFKYLSSLGRFDHILLLHPFYYGSAALEYARKSSTKISCYFHGFELNSQLIHRDKITQKVLGFLTNVKSLKQLTLGLVKKVDFIFTNSSETAELVRKVRTSNLYITGCGLDVDTVSEKLLSRRCLSQTGRGSLSGKTLGFIGRLVESKNVRFLLDLLRFLPDFSLIVVGTGPERESLEERALTLGVEKQVKWLGKVAEEDKWDAIDQMDLLCLPSRRLEGGQVEGFGIVMLEATLRGVPIAVSHEGGMKDFVLCNNGIYLDIKNKKNSAEVISSFLADHDRVDRAVNNAQLLLTEKLTYKKIAKGICDVIELDQVDSESQTIVA